MRVLLLDTSSLFFRAYYALPPMSTRSGTPTNALYGFSSWLLKVLREEKPDGIALARDLPGPTFRHHTFPQYKSGRPPLPDELRVQLSLLDELLDVLGFPVLAVAGFEADDVLATMASKHGDAGQRVVVVSGDRDLLQVVGDRVQVLFVGQRGKPDVRYDEAAVEARFGASPGQLPFYVAFIGDSSDNIPGVPGIGPATAKSLVREYGQVQRLLAELKRVKPARVQALVEQHQTLIQRNEQLIRLRADVPLPAHSPQPFDEAAKHRTRQKFLEWEFRSLVSRLDAQ